MKCPKTFVPATTSFEIHSGPNGSIFLPDTMFQATLTVQMALQIALICLVIIARDNSEMSDITDTNGG